MQGSSSCPEGLMSGCGAPVLRVWGSSLSWCMMPWVWPCRGSGWQCLLAMEWDGTVLLFYLSDSKHLIDSRAGFRSLLGTPIGSKSWSRMAAKATTCPELPFGWQSSHFGGALEPRAMAAVALSGSVLWYWRPPQGRAIYGLPSHLFLASVCTQAYPMGVVRRVSQRVSQTFTFSSRGLNISNFCVLNPRS